MRWSACPPRELPGSVQPWLSLCHEAAAGVPVSRAAEPWAAKPGCQQGPAAPREPSRDAGNPACCPCLDLRSCLSTGSPAGVGRLGEAQGSVPGLLGLGQSPLPRGPWMIPAQLVSRGEPGWRRELARLLFAEGPWFSRSSPQAQGSSLHFPCKRGEGVVI